MSDGSYVKLKLPSADKLIRSRGLDPNGRAQMFHTMNVNQRIGKYMPKLSGTLETKLKHIKSGTEIEILGPYAKYQYYGKVMKGKVPKEVTDKPLDQSKGKNPLAGPFWDRALVAAEGQALTADLQRFIDRRGGND